MKIPEDTDKLEDLLKNKDFADLTNSEKTWVLQCLHSEEAYTMLRFTEQQLTRSFSKPSDLYPRPAIRTSLRTQLQTIRPKPGLSTRVWLQPIPAYQVAAGLLVLLGSFFLFTSRLAPSLSTEGSVSLRDTVFVIHHDTIIQEKKIVITRYKTIASPVTTFKLNYDTTGIPIPSQIQNPSAQGVSMKEDTLLQHFFIKENER